VTAVDLNLMSLAACRDVDPEFFFPNGRGVAAVHQAQRAERFCRARCPVMGWCEQRAKTLRVTDGVWGGHYRTQSGGDHA
jgi:WhiB family redox-sensing transcriptional regulator